MFDPLWMSANLWCVNEEGHRALLLGSFFRSRRRGRGELTASIDGDEDEKQATRRGGLGHPCL